MQEVCSNKFTYLLSFTFTFSLGRMASSSVDFKPMHPERRPKFGSNALPQNNHGKGKVIRIAQGFCKPQWINASTDTVRSPIT